MFLGIYLKWISSKIRVLKFSILLLLLIFLTYWLLWYFNYRSYKSSCSVIKETSVRHSIVSFLKGFKQNEDN